jgi:hypothetical protein
VKADREVVWQMNASDRPGVDIGGIEQCKEGSFRPAIFAWRRRRATGSIAAGTWRRRPSLGWALTKRAVVTRVREAAPIPARSASRPTCLTCSGRLGGAAAAGRRRQFFLVFHRALPDLQRMKLKPDQAFGHREVFCFFLVFHRALPDLQRMKLKPDQAIGHREVFCFFLAELLLADSGADDGARAIGADADRLRLVGAAAMVPAPIERREVRGHRQQIGKSAALTVGALALALSALRPLRLRKISGSCSFCSFWSARSSGPPPNVCSVAVARRRVSTQAR